MLVWEKKTQSNATRLSVPSDWVMLLVASKTPRNIMKHLVTALAFIAGLCAGLSINYTRQPAVVVIQQQEHHCSTKDYEAACFFADVIHCAMDWDTTSNAHGMNALYDSWVEDLDSCRFECLTVEDLNNYSWCY